MSQTITKPNYGRSILSISSSILNNYGLSSNYKTLKKLDKLLNKNYKNIVFLILDCMGVNIIENNLKDDSIIKNNILTTVTTVFPPTTAAATTSFHSGLSPYESGWIGWMPYFKKYDKMIEMFSGKDFYTGEQVINEIEPSLEYKTIYQKIHEKNNDIRIHKLFPSFAENGSNTFEELCSKIKKACNNNDKNLISAYWDDPDYTIHRSGVSSQKVKEVLKDIDNNIKTLKEELTDTLIIISADHGAVDVEEVFLNDIKEIDECLEKPLSIEARFVSIFVKEGMKERFKEMFDKYFKDKYEYKLYTKEDFLNENLLGKGKKHEMIDSYLGDYIFISNSHLAIRYSITGENENKHVADHAGITKDEMVVPVITIKCNKKD